MAKRLQILTHPNHILRQKTVDISPSQLKDKIFQTFLDDLTVTMKEADGIGLAAIQTGERASVIVVMMDEGPMHFINPKILSYGKKKKTDTEGCLSVPGLLGLVARATEIRVHALARTGEELRFVAHDYFARVLQHEIDHLNGILYIDRAEKIWDDTERKKNA
jgi:peptide deformylase